MRWVTCAGDGLRIENGRMAERAGAMGVCATAGAVHELLFDVRDGGEAPVGVAVWCLKAGVRGNGGAVVWCDVEREVYPPGLAGIGVYLLRPNGPDVVWAVAECLRCRGVGAVVGQLPARLSRVEARRMQLAAEQGGGVGILMRQMGRGDDIYAAATRWRVKSAVGDRRWQRWKLELVHGHGRQSGESYLLECRRGTEPFFEIREICVRAPAGVGDNTEAASGERAWVERTPGGMFRRVS